MIFIVMVLFPIVLVLPILFSFRFGLRSSRTGWSRFGAWFISNFFISMACFFIASICISAYLSDVFNGNLHTTFSALAFPELLVELVVFPILGLVLTLPSFLIGGYVRSRKK